MLAIAGFAFGPWILDSRTRSLTRGSERVGLSPSEYEVLHLLVPARTSSSRKMTSSAPGGETRPSGTTAWRNWLGTSAGASMPAT